MKLDCYQLPGRLKQICEGCDTSGFALDMSPDVRAKSLIAVKHMMPGVTDEDILQHIHASNTHLKSGSILDSGMGGGASATIAYEPVGTALAKRIARIAEIKGGPGCGCRTLAANMDLWGISGCEQRREEIIEHLVKNRDVLIDSLKGWTGYAAGLVLSMAPESVLKAGADWLLTQAIEDVRGNVKPVKIRRQLPATGGIRGAFTMGTTAPRFVTSAQFQKDILNLVGKIPPDITAIAGVARSGLSAATMLSMYLHLPMITIRQTMNDIVPTGNGWRLGGSKHIDPKREKILIVDDTVMTGNSLKAIQPLVEKEFKNAIYAAVYVNPKAARKPDIWAVDLPWPHILEWNVFNSILSPSSAMDFDGILCHDCPSGSDDDGQKYRDFIHNARPLYVPRRCPIPLIVTARIEKYRAETEAWLRLHNIRWHKLVMHPAKTLAERRRDNIGAFKARHYSAWAKTHKATPGPHIFFESEDSQAREIARISQLLTICPSTAGAYQ